MRASASLARQAIRARTPAPISTPAIRCLSSTPQLHAARAPSVRRAAALDSSARTRPQSAYSRSDTELKLNENVTGILAVLKDAKKQKALDMEPEHALQLMRACARAPKTKAGWEAEFVEEMNTGPEVLMVLGLILERSRVSELAVLGGRMLLASANLGYLPGILRILEGALRKGEGRLRAPALLPALTKLRWYALKQENAAALVLLGRILKSERKLDEAFEMFQKAAEVDREAVDASDYDISSAQLNQGLIHLQRGRHEQAKECFERAALDGDNAVAYHHLALCLEEENELRKTYLMKAAASGVPGTCRDLAKEFLKDGRDFAFKTAKKSEAVEFAEEWAKVSAFMEDEGSQEVLDEVNELKYQLKCAEADLERQEEKADEKK